MIQPTANSDIWAEILRYFRISFSDDTEDEITDKRRTILSVALTCSELADAGLDELWRSMITLEPAARILGDAFIFEARDQYWSVNVFSSEINIRVTRLQSYLQRIRYLHFRTFPNHREQALWQALPTPQEIPFLCPNLKGLYLPSLTDNDHWNTMNNFSPLLSPSLVEVTISAPTDRPKLAVSVLLSIFKRHNIQLLDLSYHGHADRRLFHHISQFSSLSSLITTNLVSNDGPFLESANITFFQNLSHLTRLEIDMRIMREGFEIVFGDWLAGLGALSILSLHGRSEQISCSIFGTSIFKSLRSLSLDFKSPSGATGTDLFSNISRVFPALQSLVISSDSYSNYFTAAITSQDVMMLKGRMIERIDLRTHPIALNSSDIINLLITWPMLQEICIESLRDRVLLDADFILSRASVHGVRLRSLRLPLYFSSLTAKLPPTFSPPNCPLHQLKLCRSGGIPHDFGKKSILVRNLINLFPRLETLEGCGEELSAILNAFQEIARCPPQRYDHLFY